MFCLVSFADFSLRLTKLVLCRFFWVTDLYVPREDGRADNVFICESLDATSHFETATADIMAVYERVTGNKLDLVVSAEPKDLSSDQ